MLKQRSPRDGYKMLYDSFLIRFSMRFVSQSVQVSTVEMHQWRGNDFE